ncbi:hypothetical protein KY312_00205 [Candidatus Woesearchaeota archaeon]|nr:hypothetical protein [Candidatus Woesearchaeota archaeon]
MNKRGTEEVTITEIVVLVIVGVGIVVGLVPVLAKFLGGEARGVDQGTRVSIHNMREGIENLIASKTKQECYIDFGLQEDVVFVGFGRNQAIVTDTIVDRNFIKDWFDPNEVQKPQTCLNYACIVLCDVGGYWDYGEDDVAGSDCLERGRTRPIIFENVQNIKYIQDSQVHDLVVYSNILKFDRLKLKKESIAANQYHIYVSQLTTTITELGEPIEPCRTILAEQNE